MRRIQARSPPAQKLLPAPRSTTQRTEGSAPSVRKAAVNSAIMPSSNALCSLGRFSVSVATPWSITVRTGAV